MHVGEDVLTKDGKSLEYACRDSEGLQCQRFRALGVVSAVRTKQWHRPSRIHCYKERDQYRYE